MTARLPRPVRLLGWTSLLTDAATEAIYPLLPIFITRVLGGRAVALGVIEGAAEATSSVLKLVAGRLSDRLDRRKPLVLAGYTLSTLARPFIALAASWTHVLALRLADRTGKGLRGAPRDAMLAALAPEGARGRVFGFHRAMDHTGAVIGPLAAAAFLWVWPGEYRTLFALTIVPGSLAVATLLFVPDVTTRTTAATGQPAAPAAASGPLPAPLRRFLWILFLFTLGNSTDAFLLLRLTDAGLPAAGAPLAWAGLHVVKAGLSTAGGALSDRLGRRELILGGWVVYAVVYAGFAWSGSLVGLLAWFGVYGVYFALVEGSEKALVADLAPARARGTAFGWYNAVLGFGSLAASLLFGALWELVSPAAAFLTGAGLALGASGLLLVHDFHRRGDDARDVREV